MGALLSAGLLAGAAGFNAAAGGVPGRAHFVPISPDDAAIDDEGGVVYVDRVPGEPKDPGGPTSA